MADNARPLNGVLGTNNTILFKDTDVLDYVKQHNTATQDYNLTFSGGNDRGNYYASLGYYKSDGALPDTFYERYNFSFTGGYKIAKWLQANSVFNFTRANWNNEAGAMTTARCSAVSLRSLLPHVSRMKKATRLTGCSFRAQVPTSTISPKSSSVKMRATSSR